MRYSDEDRESENVEDRRGQSGGGLGGGFPFPGGERGAGGGFPFPMGRGGMSLTTMLIIGAIMLLLGMNPLDLLRDGGGGPISVPDSRRFDPGPGGRGYPAPGERTGSRNPFEVPGQGQPRPRGPRPDDELARFSRRVLADTEDVWRKIFESFGSRYEVPKLVLYDRSTPTGCGPGQSALGPFYCPADRKLYIDLTFFKELETKLNSPGDFAQAYVIAHEIGHHVQTLLGISDKVQARIQRSPEREGNKLQVRMELQADCFAGVWANLTHKIRNRLEPGDVEEGMNAASQIGDDTLQKKSQGRVVPDSFTHGSSAQRVRWFKRGLESGQIQVCDTFSVADSQL